MNKKIFIWQTMILFIKGLLPLITFYVLDKLTSLEYFSVLLICISLSNLVANLSNLSANTMAPIYFQISNDDEESRCFFQAIRLAIGLFLIIVSSLYLYFYTSLTYYTYISILLFQFSLSILPLWHYYILNKVELILFYEALVRLPVYISLPIAYLYSDLNWLFYAYNFVSLAVIAFNVYYLFFDKKVFEHFSKRKMVYVKNYIFNVFPYNFVVCLINSGFVFLSGHFLKPEILVQISFAERIKMILLQFNGVLLMAKLPSNRDLLRKVNEYPPVFFVYKNLDFIVIVIAAALTCMMGILFFSKYIYQFFGSYSKEYLSYYFLVLLVAPASSVAALLLNHYLLPVIKPFFLRKVIKFQLLILLLSIALYSVSRINAFIIAFPLFIEVGVLVFLLVSMCKLGSKTRDN